MQQHIFNGTVWVPVTDELHRDSADPHPGVVVLEGDSRLTNARTPTAHASSHGSAGSDPVSVTALGGFPGGTATFLRADGSFASPGAAGFPHWEPNAAPLIAHACDDEMQGAVVDAKHIEWDQGGVATYSMDTTRKMLKAVGTSDGTARLSALLQAVPDTEFAAYTKVDTIMSPDASAVVDAGLILTDGTGAGATARCVNMFHYDNASDVGQGSRCMSHAAYNSPTILNSYIGAKSYLRLRRNGSDVWFDHSHNGVTWHRATKFVYAGITHFGLGFAVSGGIAGYEATAYWQFLRVFSGAGTSGYHATSIGRYV